MGRRNATPKAKRVSGGLYGRGLGWHVPGEIDRGGQETLGLLPEKQDPLPVVTEWPEFIRGCVRYRQSLDEQAPRAPRSSEPYGR